LLNSFILVSFLTKDLYMLCHQRLIKPAKMANKVKAAAKRQTPLYLATNKLFYNVYYNLTSFFCKEFLLNKFWPILEQTQLI